MPTNTYISRLIDLLDSFNLRQSVTTPTHQSGHIRDWVIHRKDDDTLLSATTSPVLQSDHYSVLTQLKILTQLNIFKPPPHAVYIEARNVAAIDLSSFRSDLQAGLDSCTTLSAEQLHRLLQNSPGSARPCHSAQGFQPPPSPWFCAVGPQLLEAKRERRRAERQRLKSGLEVHKQIFRSACKLVSKIVRQAKSTFCNTKILACTSSKQLFNITNTLIGKSETSSLPSCIPSALVRQRFCDFFVNKISTIRDNLNSQTMPLPPVTHTVFDGSPLTAFHHVSQSIVREVLNKTAIKTCELDPLPSSLLAELIDDLLPSFTSVINDSFDRQLSFCGQIRRCQAVAGKNLS